jgi:CRISPR/Cas system endoribonuclease Cas6 (RAMP superfamily)
VAVHIYTQTIHRTTQITTNVEECRPCLVFASFTLEFALQLRKKHGETSVRVRKTSVRVQEKPRSEYKKNLSQSTRKTSVRVQDKPQSHYKKNLSCTTRKTCQSTRNTSVALQEKPVRVQEKPQSHYKKTLSQSTRKTSVRV